MNPERLREALRQRPVVEEISPDYGLASLAPENIIEDPEVPNVFGTGLAAVKTQDDTEYTTLGPMNVVCSHCHALHWTE
ncbi:hypothetical protein BGZ46_004430, partial [Entomortierella lignicola]